jgi:hypothetical protein
LLRFASLCFALLRFASLCFALLRFASLCFVFAAIPHAVHVCLAASVQVLSNRKVEIPLHLFYLTNLRRGSCPHEPFSYLFYFTCLIFIVIPILLIK